MKKHYIILFLVLVFSTTEGLLAQSTDTMYVVKRHVVRDTVYLRDTVRIQDTIIIADYIHSVEFKRLFYELNGADAQTPSPSPAAPHQTKVQKVLHDSPFNGVHFGYTLEANLVHPVEMTSVNTGAKSFSSLRFGGRLGLECSYNFADYFGVSAALDFGYIGKDKSGVFYPYYGVSMPLKFEFHHPVADKLWVTANVGTQLRMPWSTILYGYDGSKGSNESSNYLDDFQQIDYHDFAYNRRVFYADIMVDVGLYFQLPNQDYLRFLVGLNVATTDYSSGTVLSGAYLTMYDYPYVSQRNHYLYGQIAYLHSFSKQRAIMQAQPHWNADKSFYRHEFRLGVSDPLGFTYLRELFGSSILGEPIDGISPTKQIFTPVFSMDYHYRASKWFWLGLTAGYNLYKEKGYGEPENLTWQYKEHHILIMPSLRFSYLNRPHLTLYSGLSVGLYIKHGREYRDDDCLIRPITTDHNRVFSAFQLTAFGLKAGAKHWFGSFEAGFGIKGIVNFGVGYEF